MPASRFIGDALDFSNKHKKSLDAYVAGAKEDETECLVRLGTCYLNGRGVKKDPQKAIEIYGKSVENGEPIGLEAIKRVYSEMVKRET